MPILFSPGRTRAPLRALAFCIATLTLAGCMSIVMRPATLAPAAGGADGRPLQLARPVSAVLTNDVAVTLPGNSQWSLAGSIPQGQVYRKVGGTLMIDAKRVREAYLVVSGDKLAGFYFPGEASFTPLSYTPPLKLEQTQ
ncbi:hypothetical protein [Bordetella genomosp. 11]|uniref:Lipoprotein n=1 Tax=Bordetella genomosp. 11 TaxID=1416808 RepID=A0A261V0V2_9BORD|nr:hypothetical protein [Bordetella genomosp. 11]OZI67150.1 hypothetical protein CAL28_05535 [Bordetella genomosp. 11]